MSQSINQSVLKCGYLRFFFKSHINSTSYCPIDFNGKMSKLVYSKSSIKNPSATFLFIFNKFLVVFIYKYLKRMQFITKFNKWHRWHSVLCFFRGGTWQREHRWQKVDHQWRTYWLEVFIDPVICLIIISYNKASLMATLTSQHFERLMNDSSERFLIFHWSTDQWIDWCHGSINDQTMSWFIEKIICRWINRINNCWS